MPTVVTRARPLRQAVTAVCTVLAAWLFVRVVVEAWTGMLGRGSTPWWVAMVAIFPSWWLVVRLHALHRRAGGGHAGLALAAAVGLAVVSAWVHVSRVPAPYVRFHGIYTDRPSTTRDEWDPRRPRMQFRYNRYGFRGADWSDRPAPGRTRVAVVGDSFVFGFGSTESETIPGRLAALFEARGAGTRVEVLNLGIPGDNLVSHVTLAGVAYRELGAGVLVLVLTVPNDLTAWDRQTEIAASSRLSGFSLTERLFGNEFTNYAASNLLGNNAEFRLPGLTRGEIALVDAEVRRLGALLGARGPRLVVTQVSEPVGDVAGHFSVLPGTLVVPPIPPDPALLLPGDGHLNAAGNDRVARRMFEALAATPEGARILTGP